MAKPEGHPLMRSRSERQDGLTVDQLLDWCIRHDLDPAEVKATAAHLSWRSPETSQERDAREAFEAAAQARREAWERREFERLSQKFVTPPDSPVVAEPWTDDGHPRRTAAKAALEAAGVRIIHASVDSVRAHGHGPLCCCLMRYCQSTACSLNAEIVQRLAAAPSPD